MSANFTPGPWILATVKTSVGICHKVGPFPPKRDGDTVRHACLYADYPSTSNPADEELLANARLIAAAPELLEACKRMMLWFEVEDDHSKMPEFMHRVDLCNQVEMLASAAIAKATGEPQ